MVQEQSKENPFAGLDIDFENKTLSFSKYPNEEPVVVEFTPREFYYLQKLLQNFDRVSSKVELNPSKNADMLDTRAVDTHMSRIRGQLKVLFEGSDYSLEIKSLRRQGYQLQVSHPDSEKSGLPFLLGKKKLFLRESPHRILTVLCDKFQQAVTQEDMGYSPNVETRSPATHAYELKAKFTKHSIGFVGIDSVRGVGYSLMPKNGYSADEFTYDPSPDQTMLAGLVGRFPQLSKAAKPATIECSPA